jgi:hypothetical protein
MFKCNDTQECRRKNKDFGDYRKLQQHNSFVHRLSITLHSGERQDIPVTIARANAEEAFTCPVASCSKRYFNSNSMLNHVKKHHLPTPPSVSLTKPYFGKYVTTSAPLFGPESPKKRLSRKREWK